MSDERSMPIRASVLIHVGGLLEEGASVAQADCELCAEFWEAVSAARESER